MNTANTPILSKNGEGTLLVGLLTLISLQAISLVYFWTGGPPIGVNIIIKIINLILHMWWQRKKWGTFYPTMEALTLLEADQMGRLYWNIEILSWLFIYLMSSPWKVFNIFLK